jgi:putative peptidoglycan lipid II flippase
MSLNRDMSLVKSTATIGSYTLISRVLGFLRDVTIASGLGAGMLSDAFFVAFKLPNFLRRLFAEGAFNSAFVPIFAGMLATEGEEKAKQFASEAMSFLVLLLLITTLVFIVFMPWLMFILAPGFSDNPTKYDLTVLLTRITFPYIIFISLVSLLGGILNSRDKFAAVAATPILMNLCLIIIPSLIGWATPNMAYSLAIAVMISGILQWLWLVHFTRKQNMLPKLVRPRLTPQVKKLLVLIAPAAMGAGVAQINLFIDLIIASQFDSGVSYLYYADRISELPLAVIGIAVGTALLPMLSKQIREGNHEKAYATQRHAIELALFLSVPAAMALFAIAEPIITVVYQRGAFTAGDTTATYTTLMAFAVGLPAFVLIKILAPAFYAHQDTKTPFKIAMICIFINLIFNLTLMVPFKWVGMAMATTIAGWVNVALMARVLTKRTWLNANRELYTQITFIAAISAVMAVCVYATADWLAPLLTGGEILRATALLALVVVGVGIYSALAFASNTLGVRTHGLKWIRRNGKNV